MSVKLVRAKKRLIFKTIFYRLIKLPIPRRLKLKMLLNLEWIFERLAWETSWAVFGDEDHPLRTLNRRFLLDCVRPEHSVVDLGCKHGYDSYVLSGTCNRVIGIDFDHHSIELARRKYKRDNLKFIAADGIDFLSRNLEMFDVLVLSHVLEHLDEPIQFLRDFTRFFRFIYIEVPDFDRTPLNHLRLRLGMDLLYSDDDHVTEFDRIHLAKIVEACGIEIISSDYYLGNVKLWCRVRPCDNERGPAFACSIDPQAPS